MLRDRVYQHSHRASPAQPMNGISAYTELWYPFPELASLARPFFSVVCLQITTGHSSNSSIDRV